MFTSTFILGLYYSQEAIGTYAIFSSYIVIIAIFTSLRLEQGISKAKCREDVLKITDLVIMATFVVTILYFVILYPSSYIFETLSDAPLNLIYFGSIALTIFNITNSMLTYGCKFGLISNAKILKAIIFVALLYLLKDFDTGIILAFIFSHLTISLYTNRKFNFGYKIKKTRFINSIKNHKEYEYIYRYSAPNACLNVVSQQIPIIAGSLLYPASIIGTYFLYDKILRTPAVIIMQSLRPVLIRYYSNTNSSDVNLFYRHVLLLIILAASYVISMFALSHFVLSLGIIKEWEHGYIYIVPILIISFSQISNTATVPYLLHLKKTANLFYLEVFNLLSRVLVAVSCLYYQSESNYFFLLISLISLLILFLNILIPKLTSVEVENVKP
ncbi:hypothetical protein [Grimontia sp. SpTr1]|uniref:hypothetical protein n=1 Tax=Grimontia sp. SpTr1 TaxID=2995319 RepID=UPI00248BD745|nr:hypothetical protein [Grimontia sp. SpTr1]